MTATIPVQRQAAYRGVIYGIDVIDHDSFMAGTPVVVPNDYVGKTRQRGRGRENQHRDKQPFADLIVGSPHVLWEGICTEDELDELERRFIQDAEVRPRLNEKMNEDNPHMISKEDQRDQRWARDDRLGRPRWRHPDRRDRSSLLDWTDDRFPAQRTSDHPSRVTRSWTPLQIKLCLWSVTWLTTGALIWGVSHRLNPSASTTTEALFASGTSTVLLLWALAGAPITRRQWRRFRRQVGRRLHRKARR